jgi:hypothetical protein
MIRAEELNQAAKLAAVERLWQGADDAAIANYACKLLSESLAAAEASLAALVAALLEGGKSPPPDPDLERRNAAQSDRKARERMERLRKQLHGEES